MEIKFTIPGEPTGKARPRVTKWGVHNTEKTVLYENLVKTLCPTTKLNGYIQAEILCFYGIPKSFGIKKREDALSYKIRPDKKPDLDNIMKILLDALNGIAYEDDKQIVQAEIGKFYSYTPRVEVFLKEI